MPRKAYNNKSDFDADYSIGAEPEGHPNTRSEIRLNYNRATILPICQNRAEKLVEIFAWPLSTKILIVGAGYAWTAEVLESVYGYTNIVTTDTSVHIQSTQDSSEEAEIDAAISASGLNPASGEGLTKKNGLHTPGNRRRHSRSVQDESLSNNGSRNRIKNILGDFEVGITEEVIATLDDVEVVTAAGWIDNVNAGLDVIHLTSVIQPAKLASGHQDPIFNWKTLADWKALVPSHTFVSLQTWEVL
jgi:hypothetical protein